jgi:SpoVK/Ycf46/Vps4 family AAA+-type ATPase
MEGALRQRHTELAARFYQQALRLGQSMTALQSLPGTNLIDQVSPMADFTRTETSNDASSPIITEMAVPSGGDLSGPHNLDDLIGVDAIRQIFRARFVYPLQNPARAERYRQQAGGGVLLFGPPGTGKTLLTRALAAELGIPVFSISPSALLSKWLGDSEKQLAEVFKAARQHPASLIFVDEIDALAPSRDGADGNGAMQRLLAQLLTELDGFSHEPGQLLFMGATNRPWDVDAALLRPGRFDALIYVGLPDTSARVSLLEKQLEAIPLVPELNLVPLAETLEGYSAAETVAVATQAARLAFLDAVENDCDRPVGLIDLQMATQSVHRASTPNMLNQFRQFLVEHGLPALSD